MTASSSEWLPGNTWINFPFDIGPGYREVIVTINGTDYDVTRDPGAGAPDVVVGDDIWTALFADAFIEYADHNSRVSLDVDNLQERDVYLQSLDVLTRINRVFPPTINGSSLTVDLVILAGYPDLRFYLVPDTRTFVGCVPENGATINVTGAPAVPTAPGAFNGSQFTWQDPPAASLPLLSTSGKRVICLKAPASVTPVSASGTGITMTVTAGAFSGYRNTRILPGESDEIGCHVGWNYRHRRGDLESENIQLSPVPLIHYSLAEASRQTGFVTEHGQINADGITLTFSVWGSWLSIAMVVSSPGKRLIAAQLGSLPTWTPAEDISYTISYRDSPGSAWVFFQSVTNVSPSAIDITRVPGYADMEWAVFIPDDDRGTTVRLVLDYDKVKSLGGVNVVSFAPGWRFTDARVSKTARQVLRFIVENDSVSGWDTAAIVPVQPSLDGRVVLEAGYNVVLDINLDPGFSSVLAAINQLQFMPVRSVTPIYFNVDPGQGRGTEEFCASQAGLRSVNGVQADSNGNLMLTAVDCYRWERAAEEPQAIYARPWPGFPDYYVEVVGTGAIRVYWTYQKQYRYLVQYSDSGSWINTNATVDIDQNGQRAGVLFQGDDPIAAQRSWRVIRYAAGGVPAEYMPPGGISMEPAVTANALKLINDCKPCCSCTDYVNAYNRLKAVWDRWQRAYNTYAGPDNEIEVTDGGRIIPGPGFGLFNRGWWRLTAELIAADTLAWTPAYSTSVSLPTDPGFDLTNPDLPFNPVSGPQPIITTTSGGSSASVGPFYYSANPNPPNDLRQIFINIPKPKSAFKSGDRFFFKNEPTSLLSYARFIAIDSAPERFKSITRIWESRRAATRGVHVRAFIYPAYGWRWTVQVQVLNNTSVTYKTIRFDTETGVWDSSLVNAQGNSTPGYLTAYAVRRSAHITTPARGRELLDTNPHEFGGTADVWLGRQQFSNIGLAPGTMVVYEYEMLAVDARRRRDVSYQSIRFIVTPRLTTTTELTTTLASTAAAEQRLIGPRKHTS